jgi:hypothetical protein
MIGGFAFPGSLQLETRPEKAKLSACDFFLALAAIDFHVFQCEWPQFASRLALFRGFSEFPFAAFKAAVSSLFRVETVEKRKPRQRNANINRNGTQSLSKAMLSGHKHLTSLR